MVCYKEQVDNHYLLIIRNEHCFDEYISNEKYLSFINEIIEEHALIPFNKKFDAKRAKLLIDSIKEKLSLGRTVVIAILDNKNIIGLCYLSRRIGRQAHNSEIEFLAIKKAYRGKGYGSLLINTAIKEAFNTLKAKQIWISYIGDNEAAKYLYTKVGFKPLCKLKSYDKVGESFRNRILMVLSK